MAGSNRRNFLKNASLGAVGVAAVAAPELLFGGAAQAGTPALETPIPAKGVNGPIVVFLRDAGSGEFTVMHGERSSTFVDKGLAARLTHEVPKA
ncbi:twin-arginine translocation signal domain-containing protein [Allobranchiibius sp. GilTou38]|uniref:twin-arginine translocation signal domain-containing protein n=1 Tax=Allobranchiibius sp. GilTou38 TaxID=2815210 RepID=UPI001AA14A61|nr:twin-arginine translocation signal domain-containing protein [Allobranchiibius sp. GilTou38]MBO1766766.1 twin-arginine translocation signal domain-containing protein [Allobranchiibius sp. GilTou38]